MAGRGTGGSVNIDGTSAVRRSCSLAMVAENLDINNFYWGVLADDYPFILAALAM